MTSNILAGERRWATARRGGMTVLGKVAVPKPLNLPSQRLENHGMDPNVEIVPKGTLSWGSRSSSSSSNPWVSSSLSPGADGGTVSPSHLSGRPSSGGSGTRPSTAGSDRTHEPVASAWGSNSRPSSASGTLSSNQTSTASLRPRSAENRPNSSQLSRFAEPVSKSSTAWGPSSTAERLGVRSLKDDGFSLSSGDFPTLGSEKDDSVKNVEPKDHSRPSSASGRIAQTKEDITSQADVMQHGTVNTWRDGPRTTEDDIHPSMEKWQGEPHQYFNANNAPQHFDSWRGPPMNGPGGGWYGGRPRGPAFGGPIPPGGFPMEPFPYYRPPPPLAGSQPVPPPGVGPRGPHPKNGDLYRSQMPDAYARPGMPFRPGFYPGHPGPPGPHGPPGPPGPMPFEGYYGPPMGYCNSERDIPYMGAGPPVYNGYPAPPDIGNSHGRVAERGPSGRTLSEHVEPDHFGDNRRVPLKNHDSREERENREHNMKPNVSYSGKSRLPMTSYRKSEWGAEDDTEEPMFSKRTNPAENSSGSYEYRGHSADGVKVKSFEGMGSVKAIDDTSTNKSESVSSFPPETQPPLASGADSLAATKNSALMHKIDGLNAKIRVADGRHDAPNTYRREDERNVPQEVDIKINNYNSEVGNPAGSFGRTPVSRDFHSVPHEMTVPVGDKSVQPMAVVPRKLYHGGSGKVDQRGKGRFNGQEADGWQRKPLSTEPSSAAAATNIESTPNVHVHGPNMVGEVSQNLTVNPTGKIQGDSTETYDSTDIQAQRAKMRELAKQRALQLQKEEEERTREQKAKALAKLEELNRRALAGEPAKQKADGTQAKDNVQGEQDELCTVGEAIPADLKFQERVLHLGSNPGVNASDRDRNATGAGESAEVSSNLPLEMQQTGTVESSVSSLSMQHDAHDGGAKKVTSQFNDGGLPKHKRASYKQKLNISLQKNLNEKPVTSAVVSEAQEDHSHVASVDITPHECPPSEIKQSGSSVNTSNTVVEPSAHQRKKNNRGSKNKHKLDETPPVPSLPPVVPDSIPGKESMEDSSANLDSSVSTVTESDTGVQAQEVCSSLPNEESQNRVSNQWKPHSRRLPRNQQANRFPDKLHGNDTVVWAPVRTHNKAKASVETTQNLVLESATNNTTKGDSTAHNSSKGKRAEMERYVPKPVAKELAQQGSPPPLSSSISSRPSAGPEKEQSGSTSSATPYVGPTVETNDGEGHHNKHKKDQGTWRQRGVSDPSHVKGVYGGPTQTSEPTKDIQQSKESVQLAKNDKDPSNAENKYPLVKDQGASGRGKKYTPRGPRATTGNNNHDPENSFSGEIDTDRSIVPKDNRTFVEKPSPHWQPKPQQGNRNAGSESVTTVVNRPPKRDHPQHKPQAAPRHDKDESVVGHHHQEPNREKKSASPKARPYSPNQDLTVDSSESAPAFNTNDQLDRNAPSGSRRNGRQNNRYGRGHESRGDWSSGHDNRQHNVPAFRDNNNNNRQRQNMHYEYQPVGPAKGNKPEKVEETADRGQGQSRRGGNSYRRQSGTAD